MSTTKLKLDEVQVESFEAGETDRDGLGTVEAHLLVTRLGQTNLCTQCGNQLCGA